MEVESRTARIRRTKDALRYRRHLVADGHSDARLQAAVRDGTLERVLHGGYMSRPEWSGLREEDRTLARTLAHAHLHPGAIYSHHSAAAIWGLPLYRNRDTHVHVLTPRASRGRSSGGVVRHADEYRDADRDPAVEEVAGLRVTSLSRTIADLARLPETELAVAAADAGLRMLARATREYDATVDEWKEHQLETLARLGRRHGVSRARKVIAFADPRADSPPESVSRLQLARLGIEVEIQVRVEGPGRTYWLDFEFAGQRCFGEMDGAIKYVDPGMFGGRTPQQVVLDEKEREDQIRGLTGYRLVRWRPGDIETSRTLGERLRSFGLRVPALD